MLVYLLALGLVIPCVYAQGQLGPRNTEVQWRGGHAAAYIEPYVVVYGGSQDASIDLNSPNVRGTNDLWVWDSVAGAWYHPQVATASTIPGQVFFAGSAIPSPGQMVAIAPNTSGGASWLQKLDTNSWSWSFPTPTLPPPQHASGYAITLLNNSLYYFGGLSVDQNGVPIQNSVLNSLYSMDANNYVWTPASNGQGVTDHVLCYIPRCNCLISYGGTTTGDKASPIANVYTYSIDTGTWFIQVQAQTVNNASPGARRLHTANCLEDRMIIFGGGTDRPYDTNVWILDVSQYPTLTWRNQPMSNLSEGPNARMGHTAVLDEAKQKIYIFGGWGVGNTYDTNMYILDYKSWGWTRVSPAGFNSPDAPIPTATKPSDTSTSTPSGNSSSGERGASSSDNNNNNNKVVIGAAVGGTIGGALVLASLCFLLMRRRRQRQKEEKTLASEFDEDEVKDMTKPGSYVKRRSMNSPDMLVPSLTDLPTSTVSENSISQSLLPPQSPNEIIMQKPNEFTRPVMRRSLNSSMLASAGIGSPTTGMRSAVSVPYMHFSVPTTSTLSSVPLAQLASMSSTIASPTTATDILSETDYVSPLERLARMHTLSLPEDRYTVEEAPHHVGLTNKIWFGTRDGVPVAMKVFGRREAWERECRALVKLKESDYVVGLIEMMTIGSTQIDYVTVLERLEPAKLSRRTIRDVTMCLAFCHANEIAFCDLKPSNIMQGKGTTHKLIDFEASRTIGQECVGLITPRYCPPEVARATTYGLESTDGVVAAASVDLWSLGCVIYELEAGQCLFPSNVSDETVLHFISHPSPLTPSLINGLRWNEQVELEIPAFEERVQDPDVRELIKSLLSRDPVKRGSAPHWLKNHPYFL